MILDSFKLHTVIVQIQYPEAYELWDRAGAIGRQICTIWPGLTTSKGRPEQQVLVGKGMKIDTTFNKSTVTLTGEESFSQRKIQQVKETFEVWCEKLMLDNLERVSTRAMYAKDFPSIKEANAELFALNLARWPTTKVFDQPMEANRNGLEIHYRFEDENSFSVLALKAEQLKYEVDLDPSFIDESELKITKSRMIVDFDRGLLGSVNAGKFRMDDWIKGYQHILRRDIDKVIKGQA